MAAWIRFGDHLQQALLGVMRHVKQATGREPDQQELARALGTYFIVNEIANQLRYLKKRGDAPEPAGGANTPAPRWRFDLAGGPLSNSLARAGYFIGPVGAAVGRIRAYAARMVGREIGEEEIARSLQSSFILSEIVNQVDWLRREETGAGRRDEETER